MNLLNQASRFIISTLLALQATQGAHPFGKSPSSFQGNSVNSPNYSYVFGAAPNQSHLFHDLYSNMGYLRELLATLSPMGQSHPFHALQQKVSSRLVLKSQVVVMKKKAGGEHHESIGIDIKVGHFSNWYAE
jgi:hypothetical protein